LAREEPFAQASVTAFAQALGRFGWVEGKSVLSRLFRRHFLAALAE
jgi:hypothetical protein